MNELPQPEINEDLLSNAANEVRSVIRELVTKSLEGAFPKNRQYAVGDHNLIYVIKEGHGNQEEGFFVAADMLILRKDGELTSSRVEQRVGFDKSVWLFDEAETTPATDLDILTYGPLVLGKLYEQTRTEVADERDFERAAKMRAFLETEVESSLAVIEISQKALAELYGIDETCSPTEAIEPQHLNFLDFARKHNLVGLILPGGYTIASRRPTEQDL